MPVLTWPAALPRPSGLTFSLKPNTQVFQSPLTQATQTLEMPGARWVAVLTWSELTDAEIRAMRAFLAEMRGRAGRVYLWDMALEAPAGIATGTPVLRNRSNLLARSQQIEQSPWSQFVNVDIDVTPDFAAAPDGTATAEKMVEATTANSTHQVGQSFTAADNTVYTASAHFKAAERTQAAIIITTKAGTFPLCRYNLSAGTVLSQGGGAIGKIKALADGWYRCSCTVNIGAGASTPAATLQINNAAAGTYVGVVGSGIYVWGAQVDTGSSPSDYLATTTIALTETQSGAGIRTSGWTPSVSGILRAGDYVGVNGELKVVTADAASDSFGNATLAIEPPLRASPPDLTSIVLGQPKCIFRLADDDQDTIPIRAPVRGSVTLTFEEVFA